MLHIRGQLLVTGLPPSCRELGKLLGLTYRGAHEVLIRLERDGKIERAPGLSRGIRIIDPPE